MIICWNYLRVKVKLMMMQQMEAIMRIWMMLVMMTTRKMMMIMIGVIGGDSHSMLVQSYLLRFFFLGQRWGLAWYLEDGESDKNGGAGRDDFVSDENICFLNLEIVLSIKNLWECQNFCLWHQSHFAFITYLEFAKSINPLLFDRCYRTEHLQHLISCDVLSTLKAGWNLSVNKLIYW